MKKRLTPTFLSVLFSILIFAGGYALGQTRWAPLNLTGAAGDTPADLREAFIPFWEVWYLVNNEYVDRPLDPDMLVEGAINGMLATLDDPHTSYLSPDMQKAAQDSLEGKLEGIGAEVESVDGAFTIVSPFDGSPAARAGLLPRDIIRQVDGMEVTGMDINEVILMVRGEAGTDVSLGIERNGERFEVTITRGVIDIPSVSLNMLTVESDKIAHIRLSRFGERTAEELAAFLDIAREEEARGMILDLRRNPGGSLDTVVEVADQFLDKGVILTEEYGDGREDVFEANNEGLAQDIPLIVLVDEGSASASEVLAGALRDQGRAKIYGQTTFGKGTVQSWRGLRNGGGVRITIARWLTPSGTWVHHQGLVPDVIIDQSDNLEIDDQLDAAINALITQFAKQSAARIGN